jgi:hypothetical protein
MKRIAEFEQMLTEKISLIENQEVEIKDFSKYLSSEGQIWYAYTSVLLGCEIKAVYKGSRYYGNDKIRLELTINYE